jgi:hypothetical protein
MSSNGRTVFLAMMAGAALTMLAAAQSQVSWRYYRPGNTGIQGDYNESIWIDTDGDPWISGYDPIAEEGGVAKFIQADRRWINVSNIDYPLFGSANDVGTSRVSDMIDDGQGNVWLGTWRGLLRMNLAAGPSSLEKFGPENSPLPGGLTRDITRAPDGSIWVSAESANWAGGGLTRYQPSTGTWTHFDGRGGGRIAAQPKSSGGYFLWTSGSGSSGMDRWDSVTQMWTHIPYAIGNPVALVSKDSVDAGGNMWVLRLADDQGQWTLDCMRPDGSWISPTLPPLSTALSAPFAAIKPFGQLQAYLIVIAPDGAYHLQRTNGTTWTDMGTVPHNGFIDDLEYAADGTIWVCGTGEGGAIRRDPATGQWQRYRVTNTSQFDLFNNDLTVDAQNGDVYACANAGPDVGGMVKFDGVRWTSYVTHLGYGLSGPWPFAGAPQSEAILSRPSNGHLVVNPINAFTHELAGGAWTSIPGGQDQIRQYTEDSLGRLWATGHYGGLGMFDEAGYTFVSPGDWFGRVQPDTIRPGTIWANLGWEILRTDGVYRTSIGLGEFPDAAAIGASFRGLAVDGGGVAWFGVAAPMSTGSLLVRADANTGTRQVWAHDEGWPFPGEHVRPQLVTPDGRVWMTYDSEYPSTDAGLLAWDGTTVLTFPAPPNGAWQWGGLPHAGILDIEVKNVPGGYELWMSCIARGIAVLRVTEPQCPADFNQDGGVDGQDIEAFFLVWVDGVPAADVNQDGGVDGQDIEYFFVRWESGGC